VKDRNNIGFPETGDSEEEKPFWSICVKIGWGVIKKDFQ
jgi:hypothetical protein